MKEVENLFKRYIALLNISDSEYLRIIDNMSLGEYWFSKVTYLTIEEFAIYHNYNIEDDFSYRLYYKDNYLGHYKDLYDILLAFCEHLKNNKNERIK